MNIGPQIGRASSCASASKKRSRARAFLGMLAPMHYGKQRHANALTITFFAVSLTGSTAWPESFISSVLQLRNGPRAAASPTAYMYVDSTLGTPTTPTSQSFCGEEPRASNGSRIACATDSQPLGGGSHSTPIHLSRAQRSRAFVRYVKVCTILYQSHNVQIVDNLGSP